MISNTNTKKLSNISEKSLENGEGTFDPHENRQLDHPNTSLETLLHVMKGCLGTGVLALPEGFKNAGMVNGIFSTILIGLFNAFCLHMLIGNQYLLCKRRQVAVLTYPESMEIAVANGPCLLRRLKPYASYITNALIISYQIGSCCVYILFVGENLKLVINTYTSNQMSLNLIILLTFIPFYLASCVKNLKLLASVSLLGNVISIGTYAVIIYYASEDLGKFKDLPAFGESKNYPLFFGTALFSLQSIGVMTTAENNMAKPKDFRKPFGVLNMAIFLITTIYILIAALGYARYGKGIESSITLNFGTDQPLGQAVRILYSLALFVSYPLNMYVVFQIFWNALFKQRLEKSSAFKKSLVDYLHRLFWVVLTYLLAISIPFLGLVISFLGNVNISLLLIIFPAVMEICIYWEDIVWWKNLNFWKNVLLILIGLLAFSTGTYSTIHEMTKSYSNLNS